MKVWGGALLGGALLGVGVIGAGCSFLLDTESLAGVAPSVDAGGDTGPNAGEASVNNPPPDGSVADGSSSDPCGPSPLFCETFDKDADPLARFMLDTDPTTEVTLDRAKSLSAPRSAKFVINPGGNASPDATLAYRIEGANKPDFVFEGSFFIERQENLFARLLRITIDNGRAILLERTGAFKIDDNQLANVGRLPSNAWVHLRLEVHPTTMTLSLETPDGSGNVTSGPVNVAPAWSSGSILFRLGISEANSPNVGWIVYWDNIVVRAL